MRKQLLFGALLLGSLFSLNAQTIVWSDDFNDEDLTNWSQTDADGDGNEWAILQIQDEDENPITPMSMISRSWTGPTGALTPDNWIVSPVVNLSAYTGQTITLSWVRQANDGYPEDTYTVYVGTSDDIASLEMSTVTFNETPGLAEGSVSRTLDMSSLAGSEAVYIAFRHHDSEDNDFISIDDVTVTTQTTAGVNEQLASSLSVYPNPANNVINVANADNILVNGIQIVDLNGRTVKSVNFDGVTEAQVNISDLANGMYMMTVSSDKGSMTKKIIKN